jgi:hypothetical protein
MPVFEVSRSYTQVARVAVGDKVRVQAATAEEARELVESGKYDEVVDGSEDTGHQEWGEIVSSIDTGDPELTDIDPNKNTATN